MLHRVQGEHCLSISEGRTLVRNNVPPYIIVK
jgi:hypothetical protein